MLSYFGLFYVAVWVIGMTRRNTGIASTRRIGLWILGLAALFGVVILVSSGGVGEAAVFGAAMLLALTPVFLVGVGLVGSTTALGLLQRKQVVAAFAVVAALLIAPLLAALYFVSDVRAEGDRQRAALAAFQTTDVAGFIADHGIGFPASPQFRTLHRCTADALCHTEFWRSFISEDEAEVWAEGAHFLEIEVIAVHDTCEGPTAPVKHCLQVSTLETWCDTRPALGRSLWCQARPRHAVVFRSLAEGPHADREFGRWSDAAAESLGPDHAGTPIRIECNETRDQIVRDRSGESRLCRVRFLIDEGVSAAVSLDGFRADEMMDEARTMLDYTNRVWRSLSDG